jgi:hypothetical protein
MNNNSAIMIAVLALLLGTQRRPSQTGGNGGNGGNGGTGGEAGGGISPPVSPPIQPVIGCTTQDAAQMNGYIMALQNGITSQFPEWLTGYIGCDPCRHYSQLSGLGKFYWDKEFRGCPGYNNW